MNGIFGIWSKDDCVEDLFIGTFGLQHRGQAYCGLSTCDGESIKIRTHRGEVAPTFKDDLQGLEGYWGIGNTSSVDRQPIVLNARIGKFTIGFDGNLMNRDELRQEFYFTGHSFATTEDVELLARLIAQDGNVAKGLEIALTRIAGPCSLTLLTDEGIYAARGIEGWRPLVLGRKDQAWAVASESCAFSNGTNLQLFRDVAPGEILLINKDGINSLKIITARHKICSFEWIYYGRPNSIIEGVPVARVRHNLGANLAQADTIEADVVGPIPNSGILHAEGYHLESKLPSVEIFLPVQYLKRTYIMEIEDRKEEKSRKLVPIEENVRGKRIVLVDDSIRAGITMRDTVGKLRAAGAKEIHVRIASPVSVKYCPYEKPPLEEEKFIGALASVEKIRQFIEADTLKYQEIDNVSKAIGLSADDLCLDCFYK